MEQALKQAYISVSRPGGASYGGNQGWLDAAQGHDRVIAGYGCGIIAAADLFLYLAKTRAWAATPMTEPVLVQTPASFAAYSAYIHALERAYVRVYNHIGMTGYSLANAVNHYFAIHHLCFCARWEHRVFSGAQAQRGRIAEMLAADIPVILSIPGAFYAKQALRLYRSARTELPVQRDCAHPYTAFGGHYVTVTGITANGFGEPVYAISSWGRRYFLDAAEYDRAARRFQGRFACGLLAVRESARPPQALNVSVRLR